MAMQSRNRYKPYQVANEKPPEGWPTTPCPYINEGKRRCRPVLDWGQREGAHHLAMFNPCSHIR